MKKDTKGTHAPVFATPVTRTALQLFPSLPLPLTPPPHPPFPPPNLLSLSLQHPEPWKGRHLRIRLRSGFLQKLPRPRGGLRGGLEEDGGDGKESRIRARPPPPQKMEEKNELGGWGGSWRRK